MGFYIDEIEGKHLGISFDEKCKSLYDAGARMVSGDEFQENLVVVVDNGFFAAAGHAFSEKEHEVFQHPNGRRTRWFVLPEAGKYSGYDEFIKNKKL